MTFYCWPETRIVHKVGNSFMIAIPPRHLRAMDLEKGDYVDIEVGKDDNGDMRMVITVKHRDRDKKRA